MAKKPFSNSLFPPGYMVPDPHTLLIMRLSLCSFLNLPPETVHFPLIIPGLIWFYWWSLSSIIWLFYLFTNRSFKSSNCLQCLYKQLLNLANVFLAIIFMTSVMGGCSRSLQMTYHGPSTADLKVMFSWRCRVGIFIFAACPITIYVFVT